ncbi:FeMo cofactor biosynthesis protein NifB [Methylocystis bryophila]|uniref:FeMo cofactor biosynthesis protein NifB n=2 Tax=Methylocystis bryophila TaxID=655015 RepID=A0A1W6MTU9_9HYPH|nr:nitrogenase cofactor biosynthesis protein NifB [Methylocystis bryophila]ARN81030.1 nitrogenase cofactor biosynthesis protein NifB [Methylocystis bryophila]BDV36948.1 FeMo cofactor biosynthesis protein NifB [Methylocystis bryophila]
MDTQGLEGLESEASAPAMDGIMQQIAEHKGCGTSGGSGKASCGSSAGSGDLPTEIWEKVKNHPCYSEEAHHHYARMHVAVAPACNIQCNYCNRKYDCANESRPGVVSEKLSPEQAAKKVLAVASTIPQMTVLGIAGPGDPLANPEKTFKTFELISRTAPDIKLCLSTNGLALPDHVDTIAGFNVDHVTITINMVDPEIGARIYPWVFWKHKRYTGVEAAKLLTDRQLQGLEMLTERGILCKVNSVMIPGVNDRHLIEVNKAVKSRGAFLHNIMPLISAAEHGTVFGLTGQRGPSAQELKALQDSCEGEMNMMRHCRQCRADAVGLLGEDRSAEFTTDKIMAMEVDYDLEGRKAYQEKVEEERVAKVAAKQEELKILAGESSDIKLLIAVATKGSGLINEHFGHAKEFQVYELSTAGAKFVGHRRVDLYCQGGYGDEDSLETVIRAINDCHAVFVAKIGGCPKNDLIKAGIEPVDQFAHEFIEKSAIAWFKAYLDKVNAGEIVHEIRGDAEIRQGALINAA